MTSGQMQTSNLIGLDDICEAVDVVITKSLENSQRSLCSYRVLAAPSVSFKGTMKGESIATVQHNIDMKETAIISTLQDITMDVFPLAESIKLIITELLMGGSPDLGLVSEIFARMRAYHPVHLHQEYYKELLEKVQVAVEKNVFVNVKLLEFAIQELNGLPKDVFEPENNVLRSTKAPSHANTNKNKNGDVRYYNNLNPYEKCNKLRFCLGFICDWIEDDFYHWSAENRPERRSLAGRLFWPDQSTEGQMTSSIRLFLQLWDRHSDFQRLLNIVAEIMRRRDRCGVQMYPFLGSNSTDLAREYSSKLIPVIKEIGHSSCDKYIWGIKPGWLRLLTMSFILTDLTGFYCSPELSSAVTIMEHLVHIYKVGRQETRVQVQTAKILPDTELVKKFKKLKSVNAFFRSGLTRLHSACHGNKENELRALLAFPELDLNMTDSYGRTSLYAACMRGSVSCVKELLMYSPPVGSIQRRVNTRTADLDGLTPLMVAAKAGHTEICSLLLQHTGSVLLDDVYGVNQTALDLCSSNDTRLVLEKFKHKRVETIYSRPELVLATEDLLLLAKCCVALIQCYFDVHRTWEVYHTLKRNARSGIKSTNCKPPSILCEYSRYHRDFRTHVNRIRTMAGKMMKIPQLSEVTDVLYMLVSLNK